MCVADLLLCQCDKANWSDINTYVYCLLAVEQMRSGNTTNGTMSKIGYEAMIYAWFKWATNQTGTARLANGGIDAPNSWWERHTKVAT
jgi:hypothetical protein